MVSRRDFVLATASLAAWPARADPALLDRLRAGGHVLLMRHASTQSGLGDPAGYRLDDCATQRNLSDAGRGEARQVGERLREARVPIERVYTSPWCRCRETAALVGFGEPEDWEPLGSFFDAPQRKDDFAERMRKRIAGYGARHLKGNVLMVTHHVNILAVTGEAVGTGEIVAVRPDGCCNVRRAGRIKLA